MISVLACIFVFGILIFIHEFGHFISAKKNGVRVEKFSFGFGRKLFSKKVGETEYLISAVPLGGYIKMAGEEPDEKRKSTPGDFLSKSCGQRAQIIAAGPILNYLLTFFLFYFFFVIGTPSMTTRVGEVLDEYPAKEAGIKKDDIVLAVDGEKIGFWNFWGDMAGIIHQKTEGEIVLDIKRADQVLKINITPKIEEYEDVSGQKRKIALIGISPPEDKYGWGKSLYKAGEKLIALSGRTYKEIWFLLTLRRSLKESAAGPIYMFTLTGSAARAGFIPLLHLMAFFSMALAIFNFLPIPVLDGGHLFFLLIEKIRKRPLSVRTQEITTQIGLLLLITLVIFVSYYDVIRLGWMKKAQDFLNGIEAPKQ